MVGARRRDRRHWPDYLVARKKPQGLYYSWKDPRDGKEYGLGYDFADAANQAREANIKLQGEKAPSCRLLDRLSGQDKSTMAEWLDRFEQTLGRRKGKNNAQRSENTIKTDRHRLGVLRAHFGTTLVAQVTTKQCMDLLDEFLKAGKDRSAQSLRGFMIDCFNEAEAAGWIPRGENPASILTEINVTVNRARLSLDQYKAILQRAESNDDVWLATALQMALLTAQRLSDVGKMRFDDVIDGYLHVVQDKEGHPIRIPVALGLPQLGVTIADVIKRARVNGIVGAATIVHHTKPRTLSTPGDRVHDNTISKGFTRTMRKVYDAEAQRKEWGEKDPPTFHELRALSKRLYDEIGVNTMTLLGHKTEEAAAIYRDRRGDWWTVDLPKKTGS